MLRSQVLKLYRDILRTLREVPEKDHREDMKQWAREEFRLRMKETDEV